MGKKVIHILFLIFIGGCYAAKPVVQMEKGV